MKKIFFVAIAFLSLGTAQASTDWSYYDGTTTLKPAPELGSGWFWLSCPQATTLCCAVDNQTGFVVLPKMSLNAVGNPVPSNTGNLIGNYDVNSVVENPDQQTTVTMNVSNLADCDNCDDVIAGWQN